ncbi:hypothetical protein TA3x_002632 [Tundrisphaera sp. TA3]|uniref:hypothetical protein n=1 Tax=Tundrisphaera sp. TA3 TaxID=3435775 RepID=UPI003EBE2004
MSTVIDLIILALVAGITYALMSEGLWGAALMFFNSLFAALIAFNFYEPLAQLAVDNFPEMLQPYADSLCMMLLYIIPLVLLRLATESIAPTMVRFPTPVYHLGRIVFGVGAALITIAMLILGYQASPVQKKMLGVMDYQYKPFYGVRFDRDFLAFFQYTTGYTFARNGVGPADGMGEFKNKPMLFDPKASWLLLHQQARPIGTEDILDEGGSEGGAAPAAPAEGGATPPAAPGTPGPGIPGGPAGAAAGLAPTTP